MEFLSSQVVHFFWALSAFIVFILIIYPIAVRNIVAAVAERDAKLTRELAESEAAYAKAKQIERELDAQMRGAEARIAELLGKAHRDAEVVRTRSLEQGRQELEAMRERAVRDIEAARHAAVNGIREQVADIAVQVAEKIIRQKLDAAAHADLVSQAIAAFEHGDRGSSVVKAVR